MSGTHGSTYCRCGVGLNPLKDVQGQESTSLCHAQIRTGLCGSCGEY